MRTMEVRAIGAGLTAAIVLGIAMAVALIQGSAGAQTYPPPVGSLTTEASTTTPSTGTNSTITATVLDSSGNPVAGADVLFTIESQPGNDAAFANGLTQITAKTGADGTAKVILSAGSKSGSIIITTISGEKTSKLTLQVKSAAGVPATGGAPPASENEDGGLATWQAALVAGAAAVVLAAGFIAVRRRV